jgi:hypothetical protein
MNTPDTRSPALFSGNLYYLSLGLVLVIGAYFRFVGLGQWPMAFDEYYIARSINNILGTGIPQYPCGGYYTRGLLYQYAAAPLFLLGLSPEWSIRAISAAAGLLAIWPAYLIVRSESSRPAAFFVVLALALSSWEVEMSRFGRMYAPYQAIFMWYMYLQYRLVRFGERQQLPRLAILSIAGVLTWEGGIFLCLLNFLPIIFDATPKPRRHFLFGLALLMMAFIFLTAEFRFLGSDPPISQTAPLARGTSVLSAAGLLLVWEHFEHSGIFFALLVGLSVVLGVYLVAVWRDRSIRPLTKAGLIGLVLLCLVKQFFLASAWAAMLLVSPLLKVEDLKRRTVLLTVAIGLAGLLFWSAALAWADVEASAQIRIARILKGLLGNSGFFTRIAVPWSEVLLSSFLILGAPIVGMGLRLVRRRNPSWAPLDHLLLAILVCLTAVALIPTNFALTRYTFFLYPLILVLAALCVHQLAQSFLRKPGLRLAVLVCFGAAFLASADFKYDHLWKIDSYTANYRIGYPGRLTSHFYPRHDFAGAAEFVNQHAEERALVVSTLVPMQPYLRRLDTVYLDTSDPRFRGQACPSGAQERWTGQPLVSSLDALKALAAEAPGTVWVIVGKKSRQHNQWEADLVEFPGMRLAHTTQDGAIEVYELTSAPAPPQT